eukprot:TRINITY_DN49645_c0_g1_i1.p1 TRINITY_DN49645_c0_g1~~TRINITY_DN49645_c0_g1_i1.p1  ORF type:complete len:112 (-),score=3.64 TRINITY_DN49645_c0_g1_i1:402-737(-)
MKRYDKGWRWLRNSSSLFVAIYLSPDSVQSRGCNLGGLDQRRPKSGPNLHVGKVIYLMFCSSGEELRGVRGFAFLRFNTEHEMYRLANQLICPRRASHVIRVRRARFVYGQ